MHGDAWRGIEHFADSLCFSVASCASVVILNHGDAEFTEVHGGTWSGIEHFADSLCFSGTSCASVVILNHGDT